MTVELFDINKFVAGLPVVEEDHIFTPVGSQSDAVTLLLNERAALLENPEPSGESEDGGVPASERSLADTYTDRRDELDRKIVEQLEADHPDAPRIRLRGLSDEDINAIQDEIAEIAEKAENGNRAMEVRARNLLVESNLRLVSRATVQPQFSTEDVRILRKSLNRGEWARLLDHVNRLMAKEAGVGEVPNF